MPKKKMKNERERNGKILISHDIVILTLCDQQSDGLGLTYNKFIDLDWV